MTPGLPSCTSALAHLYHVSNRLQRRLTRFLITPRTRHALQRLLSLVVLAGCLLQPLALVRAAPSGRAAAVAQDTVGGSPTGSAGMMGSPRETATEVAVEPARAQVGSIPGIRVYAQSDVNCTSPQYGQAPTTYSAGGIGLGYAIKDLFICSQGAYVRIRVYAEGEGYLGSFAITYIDCRSGACDQFTNIYPEEQTTSLPGFYCLRTISSFDGNLYLPPGKYRVHARAGSNDVFLNCYGAHYDIEISISAPAADELRFCPGDDPCLTVSPESTQALVGDPINTRTGNFTHQQTDFSIATHGLPLEFTRSYNSLDTTVGPLGRGWTHSYWTHLITNTHTVTLVAPHGSRLPFYRMADGSFLPSAGVRATLEQELDGSYTLTQGDQVTYTFDADGRLTALADAAGNTTTLSYDGDDLSTVTAPDGRTLTLSCDDGRIRTIQDPLSRTVVLTYTGDLLTSVRDVTGQVWEYAYDGQGRMTSLSDPLQATVENEYDGQGRVVLQRDALEQETHLAYFDDHTVVTDTLGAATTYYYNALNLLEAVTDPLGHTTTYEHDDSYNLVAVTDPLSQTTEFAWSDCGCAIETVRDPLGNETHIQYDAHNNPIAVTDALAHTTHYAYDGQDNLIAITNTLGYTATFAYDGYGQLSTSRDPYGRATQYGYDQYGNVTTITDTLGHATHLAYDLAGRLLDLEDARGHATHFDYDAAGRPLTVTDALGGETLYRYDAAGRLVELTDANGHHTRLEYDAAGRLITTTNALDGLTVRAYDAAGRLTQVSDANGQVTSYAYDAAGRLITVTNALGVHTVYGYDAAGRAIRVTDPFGEDTLIEYDALGRTVAITDTLGQATRFGYDGVGSLRWMLDPTGVLTEYTYDDLYRLQSLENPLGQVAGYAYDRLGNLTQITDGNGHSTHYTYDPLSRLETVLDPLQGMTQYGYDPVGNLISATDALGHTTIYSYDALNRLLTVSDPLQHTTAYGYDAVGNTTVITDADQLVTHLTYDALDRLTQVEYADQTVRYAYDAVGNRVAMTDTAGVTLYTYDSLYRPLTITAPFAGPVGYRYDARNLRTQILYPEGETATYGYDEAGRLRYVWDGATRVVTYTYDEAGRPLSAELANGVHSTYGYDEAGRLVSIAHEKAGEWQTTFQYELDMAGNRVAVTETTTALQTYALPVLGRGEGTGGTEGTEGTGSALPVGNVIRYTYDDADRLIEASYGNGDRYEYGYDAVGNRLVYTATQAGVPAEVTQYSYDQADRLTSVAGRQVTHDNRGNLTGDSAWTYTYGVAGRMVGASSITATLAYTYNGDGLLLAENLDGQETTFTWDQALALPQVLQTSNGLRALYGLDRIGIYQDGAWAYPLSDVLGSVRQWTDAQGTVLGLQGYGPYGEPVVPVGSALASWGYTGEWEDASGLVYLRARWYNPAWGRFTQVDPLLGILDLPATRHPYAYVFNTPLNGRDPSGKAGLLIAAAVGGLFGAVAESVGYVLAHPGRSAGEYIHDRGFWQAAGRGAISGAVGGAIGYGVGGLVGAGASKALPAGSGFVAAVLSGGSGGAASSFATQVTTNLLSGRPVMQGAGEAAWHGAAVGGVTGGIGYGVRQAVRAALNSTCPGRQTVELDFSDYPRNPKVPVPKGPFTLIEGEEYRAARAAANAANAAIHEADPSLAGLQIHEVHPVKWGGSPTDLANKVALTAEEHERFCVWWLRMQRLFEEGERK